LAALVPRATVYYVGDSKFESMGLALIFINRAAEAPPARRAAVSAAARAVVGVAAVCALSGAPAFAQADMNKVLRVLFVSAETGFDPQATGDIFSKTVNRAIFDPLYAYDHLARPLKLVPNTAVALPEISPDGTTWTIRIKPGIYFADDPAFKGKKRELVAQDYVFAWKRALDPRVRGPAFGLFDRRFVGSESVQAKANESGKLDYDLPIEGLQAIDRHTLRLKLDFADTEFLSNLTLPETAAVAREVIEAYGDASSRTMANPVGTGPYRLKEWRRGQKIVLEANPDFREVRYPESSDPADAAIMAKLRGKRIPLIGRIEISIVEEGMPRLLMFEQREIDYVFVPPELVSNVLDPPATLKPRLANQGVRLERGIRPQITFTCFNMEDPIVGGYTPDKVALRRAISMGFNTPEEIKVIRQGQAMPANQVVPPMVSGHDDKLPVQAIYDPAGARALLDRFGYKDRNGDGYRELPNGNQLTLNLTSRTTSIEREVDELWLRSMKAIGLRIEFNKLRDQDLVRAGRSGQLQMFQVIVTNFTSEGFHFLGLLYGKYGGLSNWARFQLPEYDRLYEQARGAPPGPEREALMRQMGHLVNAYAPWNLTVWRYENVLVRPWVLGYKFNGFNFDPWPYFDIDLSKRTAAKEQ
jgi:ABC-type transport system substrate-binding protein